MPIITSLLDCDFYKLTQMQAIAGLYPNAQATYQFFDRNNLVFPPLTDELDVELEDLVDTHFQPSELAYLAKTELFSPVFLNLLESFQFNIEQVKLSQMPDGRLQINFDGPWYQVMFWETFVLAIVSELYYRKTNPEPLEGWSERLQEKRAKIPKYKLNVTEFGTRRRYSKEIQELVLIGLLPFVRSTSNVALAMKYKLAPVGSVAHEFYMGHAGMFGYRQANTLALDAWTNFYDGRMGCALSDTYGLYHFFEVFDSRIARTYDGVRQDSGDPFEFTEKLLVHYRKLGIDPRAKYILYSDALTVDKASAIQEYVAGQIQCKFGIGTSLTNDVGHEPLNIVIKMTSINGHRVIKLTSDPNKAMGTREEITRVQDELG